MTIEEVIKNLRTPQTHKEAVRHELRAFAEEVVERCKKALRNSDAGSFLDSEDVLRHTLSALDAVKKEMGDEGHLRDVGEKD